MDAIVQIRQRGTLTIPANLRAKYGIEEGSTLRLVDLDGLIVLTPMTPIVHELAHEIEQARLEAGLTIEELLEGLREQRNRYYKEKYEAEHA